MNIKQASNRIAQDGSKAIASTHIRDMSFEVRLASNYLLGIFCFPGFPKSYAPTWVRHCVHKTIDKIGGQ